MSKSKLIECMKTYLFNYHVGKRTDTITSKMLAWYWGRKLEKMSEGEIMDRYYELTTKGSEMDLCLKD